MLDISNCKIMKQGILLYDNISEYSVVIIESNILYGTGDYEDSPEITEDKDCLCYYAWCDHPNRRNEFCSCSTAYMSIKEAMAAIEKEGYYSHWID